MVGMQSVVSTTKAGEVASHALNTRALRSVLRIPPLGKRRGIGFLLDQQLTAEFLDHASPAVVLDKGVVLLGRPARERLKPMRVVCGAPLSIAHCFMPAATLSAISRLNGLPSRIVSSRDFAHLGREVFSHLIPAEYVYAVVFGYVVCGRFHVEGFSVRIASPTI